MTVTFIKKDGKTIVHNNVYDVEAAIEYNTDTIDRVEITFTKGE